MAVYGVTAMNEETLQQDASKHQNEDGNASRHEHPISNTSPTKEVADGSSLNSLKYRLLGPSLTKAGQDTVDQRKVSEIIYDASKGSKFFANERVRDLALTGRIERLVNRKEEFLKTPTYIANENRKADILLAELESSRDLSQTIVHVDCDAFYAAVEQLDRPDLRTVPFAVGRGVVTTCNYEARKWGVRSGMAGFVAMKLCPQLISLPLNFTKYRAMAEKVRAVLETYDENFEPASVDEAYLNITEFCSEHNMPPDQAVSQMRAEILEKCQITVSAGIASNAKLAKLASNINKPNGQFLVPPDSAETVMAFIHPLPVRKVNGIGRVLERELTDVLGVATVQDLYTHRGLLTPLFGEKTTRFLLQTYLGLGRTEIAPGDDSDRKSVGAERTFRELEGTAELRNKLGDIAAELERDMLRAEVKGRTVVLKVKLHTFEVLTRQTPVTGPPVRTAEELERYAAPMLAKLEKEHQSTGLRLRLMGLRCTSLVSTQKAEIPTNFFGSVVARKPTWKGGDDKLQTDEEGWQVWPEAEFEAAERKERQDEADEMEKWSQEFESSQKERQGSTTVRNLSPQKEPKKEEQNVVNCPICSRPQPADDVLLNAHIDSCLSRQTIGEIVRENKENDAAPQTKSHSNIDSKKKKRGRQPSKNDVAYDHEVEEDAQGQRRNVKFRHNFFSSKERQ